MGARSEGRDTTGGAPKHERRGQAGAHAGRSKRKGTGKAAEKGRHTGQGHSAGIGQGHEKGASSSGRGRTWEFEQGVSKAPKGGGIGLHAAGRGRVGGRGHSQGH